VQGCDQKHQGLKVMPIDIRIETLLTMEEAAVKMRVEPKTIRDWADEFDYLGRPRVVVLEVTKPGGKLLTSVEALARRQAAMDKIRQSKRQAAKQSVSRPAAPATLPQSLIAELSKLGINVATT
jgi:hypothetical protein